MATGQPQPTPKSDLVPPELAAAICQLLLGVDPVNQMGYRRCSLKPAFRAAAPRRRGRPGSCEQFGWS